MVAVGNVIETNIVTKYDSNDILILNTYQHRVTEVTPIAGENVLRAWAFAVDADLVDEQIKLMTQIVRVTEIRVRNLSNNVEFFNFIYPTPRAGLNSGDVLPAFVALSFILNRSTGATRNGQKRITGVPEAWQNAGNIQAGQQQINEFAVALKSPVNIVDEDYGTISGIPVIVRKSSTGAVLVENPVSDASFTAISTQNTRKR